MSTLARHPSVPASGCAGADTVSARRPSGKFYSHPVAPTAERQGSGNPNFKLGKAGPVPEGIGSVVERRIRAGVVVCGNNTPEIQGGVASQLRLPFTACQTRSRQLIVNRIWLRLKTPCTQSLSTWNTKIKNATIMLKRTDTVMQSIAEAKWGHLFASRYRG
jgi:hypothetical protein